MREGNRRLYSDAVRGKHSRLAIWWLHASGIISCARHARKGETRTMSFRLLGLEFSSFARREVVLLIAESNAMLCRVAAQCSHSKCLCEACRIWNRANDERTAQGKNESRRGTSHNASRPNPQTTWRTPQITCAIDSYAHGELFSDMIQLVECSIHWDN